MWVWAVVMLRNGVLVDPVSFFFNTIPLLYTHCYIPYCYTPIVTCHCHHTIVSYHCHTPLLHTIVTHHCQTTMAQHHFHVLHKNSRLLVSSKNCTGTKNEGSTCPISPIPGNRQTYWYLNAHPTLTPLLVLCFFQSGHGGQIVGGLPKCDGVGLFAVRR
jgi:hypothetical protein